MRSVTDLVTGEIMDTVNNFRYIKGGQDIWSLTNHEIKELNVDFDIQTEGYHVVAALTKKEWDHLKVIREIKLLD